jgi:hypothetical protein
MAVAKSSAEPRRRLRYGVRRCHLDRIETLGARQLLNERSQLRSVQKSRLA